MTNWYDEKEIVEVVKDHLMKKGFTIRSEWVKTGPDIEAEIVEGGKRRALIVEAKGYPTEYYAHGKKAGQPKPTKPNIQARHWVADAIFTTLLRIAEAKYGDIQFALAFPKFPIYTNLMNRLRVFREKFNVTLFFVNAGKNVKEFLPTQDIS